jgi:hypothetical protein
MKTLVQYIYESKDDNYSEYLKIRAEITDKYDHEYGPEMNKKMDALEQKEYAELDKKYPEAAKRFNSEQLSIKKGNSKQNSKERKVVNRNVTKQELPAEYLKELAELEDKYDHEFGSFEKNQQMDNEYNEKLAQLKKKYNIK